jgi:GNAT superfamily N-acetyltransferase
MAVRTFVGQSSKSRQVVIANRRCGCVESAVTEAVIRDATTDDLPAILELMRQLGYPNEASTVTEAHRAALLDIQRTPGQRLLVIEDGSGRVVGTAQFMILPNLSRDALPRAVIENVCVDESVRGRGFGELLSRYCVEQARAAGCFKVALTSNRVRAGAHRFWERQGFAHSHRGYSLPLNDRSTTPDTGFTAAEP